MKKIIIVNNNMKVGGVQKSLCNLLWTMYGRYDITLLLFSPGGEYAGDIPPGVKVTVCDSLFRYLGISQSECRGSAADSLKRGILAGICRLFGRPAVMRLILMSQKTLPDEYDCAISFLHNGRKKSFYGGVQDLVLRRIKAKKKIAFLHCDYRNCGADHKENNQSMTEFDLIAACSDGCRKALLSVMPEMRDKCVTVPNLHRFDQIRSLAETDPVKYDGGAVNAVIVGRLAHEKGIDRAIKAVAYAKEKGVQIALHAVGGGGMFEELKSLADDEGVDDAVFFHGEQQNPYRFIVNADLLLVTSYHEAAPMVIDEARALGVPILTVETTSSEDMVAKRNCGWVCENSQDALNRALAEVAGDKTSLDELRNQMKRLETDNSAAISSFDAIV